MRNYAQHLGKTPQNEQADTRQVKNSAGGFVFQLTPEQSLLRWLILGAEGGTYYSGERKLTVEAARTVQACLDRNPEDTICTIVEVSQSGRAPKNDPAIFALGLGLCHTNPAARKYAEQAIPLVCRTATHLFQLIEVVNSLRGWGRGLKRAIGSWYESKSAEQLAYQVTKYQTRNGWSHKDALRLCHYRSEDPAKNAVLKYAVKGELSEQVPEQLGWALQLKSADLKSTLRCIQNSKGFVTHEMVLNEHKNDPKIWEALLEHMPMTAMIRNLGKMTEVGLVRPLSDAADTIATRLLDIDAVHKAKVHPISVLSALRVYGTGHGVRGSLTWKPVPTVSDALDEAFYLAFGNVEKSGKKTLIALDVSGSMGSADIAGVPGLTAREASAAMALVTMRTEPKYHVVGFTSGGGYRRGAALTDLNISPSMRITDVIEKISDLPFGGTDCALPMMTAMQDKLQVEAFQIWTDNETWAGKIHPYEALKKYRDASGIRATCAVIGCTATSFSIANPGDPGMLDVVGFDTATPNLLAEFAKGW